MTIRMPATRPTLELLEAREMPATLTGTTIGTHTTTATVKTFQPAPIVNGLAVGYQHINDSSSWRVRLYQDTTHYQDFETNSFFLLSRSDAIHVAAGDVTGDGVPDVITGLGLMHDFFMPTVVVASASVKVFDGTTLGNTPVTPLRTFDPFGSAFLGGIFVTTGDFDGDGHADVVMSQDRGGPGRVRIYSGAEVANPNATITPMADFMAIDDPNATGGVYCAVGDINHDGTPDLLCGAGVGGGPRVVAYDGTTLRNGQTPLKLFNDFFAFDPMSYRNGVQVAVLDANRDGFGDVLASDQAGTPRMTAFNGSALIAGTQTQMWNRLFGDTTSNGGLRMVVKDLNGDGTPDLALSHRDRFTVKTISGRFLALDGTVFASTTFDLSPVAGGPGIWVG
jgi:hypothetical protein